MTQLTINFDPRAHAAKADPATSRQAAERIAPFIKGQSLIVLNALKRYMAVMKEYPTSKELSYFASLDRYMVGRRLSTLMDNNLVEQLPERKCKRGRGNAVTWRAK